MSSLAQEQTSQTEGDTPRGSSLRLASLLRDHRTAIALTFIAGLGLLARLAQYLANRSLWLDEAYLALNILQRDFGGLLQPLADNQIAPPGFLWAVKAATQLFGDGEPALRLVPLLGGLLAILLMYRVARLALGPGAALFATAILAWSQPLIYFASELKPYATDALAALIAYALSWPLLAPPATPTGPFPSWRRVLALGLGSALLPWLSYPATFVLAGLGVALLWEPLWRREWPRLLRLVVLPLLWGVSLGLLYLLVLRQGLGNDFLRAFWRDFFAPFPPRSLTDLYWFPQSWFDFLVFAGGLPFYGLATFAWLSGAVALWRERRWSLLLALLLPLGFAVLASMLRLYPLYIRVLLFAIPPTFLLIAAGTQTLYAALVKHSRLTAVLLVLLLLFHPFYRSLTVLASPWTTEEPRPVIQHIQEQWQPGDRIYVYHAAAPAFTYYAPRFGLNDPALYQVGQVSNGDFALLREDVAKMQGTRVWFLFMHVHTFNGISEQSFILSQLDPAWPRLDALEAPGAAVFLYDMRE